jgi:hypothetical protein
MRTCLRRVLLALPLFALSNLPARARLNVRIAVDVEARKAVQLSIDAALRRMTDRKCQEVVGNFSIVVPPGDPVPMWFVDAGESDVCRSPARSRSRHPDRESCTSARNPSARLFPLTERSRKRSSSTKSCTCTA